MICYKSLVLYQYYTHCMSRSIHLNLESLLNVREGENMSFQNFVRDHFEPFLLCDAPTMIELVRFSALESWITWDNFLR